MSETNIPLFEQKLWLMVADLRQEEKDILEKLQSIQKGRKKAEDMYRSEAGRDFNPDDFTIYNLSGSILEKPRKNLDKNSNNQSVESYNSAWKASQKVIWALKVNGSMSRAEVLDFLETKEKMTAKKLKLIEQNFYSLVRREFISKPQSYGGKVELLKEM
jgi:hypothetical protein